MRLELRVFGPLTISVDGVEVRMASRLRQVLLAVLLANRGRVVPVSTLVGTMWPAQLPVTATRRLHIHIHRLRRALGDPAAVRHSPAGYALVAALDQVDIYRFDELTRRGHAALAAGDQLAARDLFREALALYRGPAFQGLDDVPTLATEAEHLAELRLVATEGRVAAELALGEHMSVVAELHQLVADHPLRERFRAQLMTALYRAGRKADALAVFRDGRRILVEELGIEPSPESRGLERAILVDDPGLTPPARSGGDVRAAAPLPSVPRHLPADLTTFTGRTAEVRKLDALVSGAAEAGGPAAIVVVSAIHGTAGIGKTALAVHASHRLAERCPDGQLFIDLHGFTPAVSPVEPGEALDRLLRALGVPGRRIPVDVGDRAGLWRSTLAGRRMLLVLDNAATEAQVEPLLPGAPGCLVLVTSRRRLTGLAATHVMPLDTLPPADALNLFTRTAGPGRLTRQPVELVAETVELCGRLPLAIRLAAARLQSRPTWSVADLVERLRDRGQRLAELGDGPRGVAAALDLSYQQLTADQRRMYRLLGLHPGRDIDPYAAAALAGTSLVQARRLLDQLLDVHLLHEPTAGRCVFHDLVRTHATSATFDQDAEPERRAALTRLLDHYRHTAAVAMDVAYPYERERRPDVPPADTPTPELPDPPGALGWLDVELPNLLAAQQATEAGWPGHTGHLSGILHRHLRTRGRYHDAEQLHHRALTATAGTVGEVDASNGLGWIYRLRGWHDLAIDRFAAALAVARTIGHSAGELDARNGLGTIHLRQGRYGPAIGHFAAALAAARAIGHSAGELDALNGLGNVHRRQGRYDLGTDYLTRALRAARATDNDVAELQALRDLGTVHRFHGRHRLAVEHYARMLEIAVLTGNLAGELDARTYLGATHRLQGDRERAVEHYARVLELARDSGSRMAELLAMMGLGHTYRIQSRPPAAAAAFQHALDIAREIGDRDGAFDALQELGRLHHASGQPDRALAHHQQALELATDLQQPSDQARAHDGLAHAHHALNQPTPARQHWKEALDILTRLGIDHTHDEEATVPTIRAHLAEALKAGRQDRIR